MAHNDLSRRQFLQRIGLAAGIAAVPSIIPASALGRAGRPAPSDRITMGFIGLGSQGFSNLDNFLRKAEVEVVAICDINRSGDNYAGQGLKGREPAVQKVEKWYADQKSTTTFSGVKGYTDFQEVLGRKDIDAVCLALPDHWHAYMAVATAKAGKDMYSEKPLARSIWEGQQMVKAVRQYKRVFQLGSQQRSGSEFRQAVELVINGYIGDLQKIYAAVGGISKVCTLGAEPVPDGFDMNMWLGNAPEAPYHHERVSGGYNTEGGTWRSWRDYSAGRISDWGAHNFDIAQWALQKDGSGPIEILVPDSTNGLEGLTFMYDNGIPVINKQGPNQGMIQFIGSKGWVGVDRGKMYASDERLIKLEMKPSDKRVYNSNNHHQDFLNCVKTRKRPIADIEVGFSTSTTYLLGEIATRLNRSLKWDPKKLQIKNDPEASALMKRELRAPWTIEHAFSTTV